MVFSLLLLPTFLLVVGPLLLALVFVVCLLFWLELTLVVAFGGAVLFFVFESLAEVGHLAEEVVEEEGAGFFGLTAA